MCPVDLGALYLESILAIVVDLLLGYDETLALGSMIPWCYADLILPCYFVNCVLVVMNFNRGACPSVLASVLML